MTVQEAHRQFKLFVDKVNSEALTEFTPTQIDVFIHEAEVRIVKQAYGRNNIYKQGFQEIQKRTDDLNTLVKVAYINAGTNEGGVVPFSLANLKTTENGITNAAPYMFFIRGHVKVQSSQVITPVYTGISLVSQDKYSQVIKDPFNKSRISNPVIFFEDNCIKVDTNFNSFTPTIFKITYLKYPTPVVWKATGDLNAVHSELPEEKQKEAIQLAVAICLENVESNRLQGNISLLNTSE